MMKPFLFPNAVQESKLMPGSITGNMDMRRNTKGFYTLEAVIFLPLVILAILSLGYFTGGVKGLGKCFLWSGR